jgi:hypothetical protein
MKKLIFALLLGSMATQSYAWGPREQGILAGVAGLWAIQQLAKPAQAQPQPQPQPIYSMPPVVIPQQVVQPAPVYVYPPQHVIQMPAPTYGQVSMPMVAYYCESARLYYPYAHSCSEGWKIFPTN